MVTYPENSGISSINIIWPENKIANSGIAPVGKPSISSVKESSPQSARPIKPDSSISSSPTHSRLPSPSKS